MYSPADFSMAARNLDVRLIAGAAHYHEVIGAMRRAQRSLWIATANLKQVMIEHEGAHPGRPRGRREFESILDLFERLVARGVEIRLLHASPPSRPLAAELRRHPGLFSPPPGIPGRCELRQCPRVHFKTIIVDGALAYLGSANFTGAGLGAKGNDRRNFELGILSQDDLFLDELQAVYDYAWRGAGCDRCRLRGECGAPISDLVAGRLSPSDRSRAPQARRKPKPAAPTKA